MTVFERVNSKFTIKRCPFCGQAAAIWSRAVVIEHLTYYAECDFCSATSGYADSEEKAVNNWNMRV
jgi:Lar family restriction alleviation protein